MKCEDVIKLKIESMSEGSEARDEIRTALEQHIKSCPGCRRTLRSHVESWALLDLLPGIEPTDDFTTRTMAAFGNERAREKVRSIVRRAAVALAAALLMALTLLFFKAPSVDLPAGGGGTDSTSLAQGDLIENLDLMENLEMLEEYGENLDLAMEYELYLALGGEESVQ